MMRRAAIISILFLSCFCMVHSSSLAATTELKIYSEVKGASIYIDDQLKGTDAVDITDIKPGTYYVKAMLGDNMIFSRVVTVTEGLSNTVLIKQQAQSAPPQQVQSAPQQQVPTVPQVQSAPRVQQLPAARPITDALIAQKTEYRSKRISVIVKQLKTQQSRGMMITNETFMNTDIAAFGSQHTLTENIEDWWIVTGDGTKLNENDFLTLVGDTAGLKGLNDEKNSEFWWELGGLGGLAVGGAVAISGATASTFDVGAFAGGLVTMLCGGTIAIVVASEMNQPHISPNYAANKAYEYNLKLKQRLGLPENYEPGF